MVRAFIISCALIISLVSSANAASSQKLFDGRLELKIPDSYKAYDPAEDEQGGDEQAGQQQTDGEQTGDAPGDQAEIVVPWFVAGGVKPALAKALPGTDPAKTVFNEEFRSDIRGFLKFVVADLIAEKDAESREDDGSFWMTVPDGASAQDVHKLFCEDFSKQWGEFTFDRFDAKSGIGRCVNVAGAFIAIYTKKFGDSLVVLEAADFVEILVLEAKPPKKNFAKMSAEEKWNFFKAAASWQVAEKILKSARLKP